MFCPNCGAEFIEGVTRCADCGVALVLPEELEKHPRSEPTGAQHEPAELVSVFRCADPGTCAIAKSILRSADVPFVVSNEMAQDLIGAGRLGGFNVALGPVEFMVERGDAEDAILLLRDLTTKGES